MPKRPTTDPEVLNEIAQLATSGYSPSDIHRMIQTNPRFGGPYSVPALRTVQEHVRRLQVHDTSGTWSLTSVDPTTAGLVLDALATIIESTEGRVHAITNAEAQWVVTIRQARPDVSPWTAFVLARSATRREARGESLDVLTLYLALAPWRGSDETREEARARYFALTGEAGMDFLREGMKSEARKEQGS
jgi:hypothetical protein